MRVTIASPLGKVLTTFNNNKGKEKKKTRETKQEMGLNKTRKTTERKLQLLGMNRRRRRTVASVV